MMRHRSSFKGCLDTTADVEGGGIGRDHVDPKGRMTSRNKFHPSLRLSVLVISGLCVVLYSIDLLLQDHARSTSTIPIVKVSSKLLSSFPFNTTTVSTSPENTNPDHDTTIKECGIWMAPSSLRPNPGFGIFTTRDIAYQESILHQPDAVSIPLHDMRRRHNMPLVEERRNMWVNVFGNVSNIKNVAGV
jgi:hypothetical protein